MEGLLSLESGLDAGSLGLARASLSGRSGSKVSSNERGPVYRCPLSEVDLGSGGDVRNGGRR